jgi:hypothetical protein
LIRKGAQLVTGERQSFDKKMAVVERYDAFGRRPGEEGTSRCNYGRVCGVLTVGGREVGQILIAEGLAHPYVCSGTSCPKRQPWYDGP